MGDARTPGSAVPAQYCSWCRLRVHGGVRSLLKLTVTAVSVLAAGIERRVACPVHGERTEPWKVASPKVKIPPSDATNQYPPPSPVAAIPTIGSFNRNDPVEP